MKGTIKTKTDRGFGFISPEGEENPKDVFFHSTKLNGITFDEIQVGDTVTFEIVNGEKGPSAENVTRV